MEQIIIVLFGIFVGVVVAGYMFIEELYEKDNNIKQLEEENKDLRFENDELINELRRVEKDGI